MQQEILKINEQVSLTPHLEIDKPNLVKYLNDKVLYDFTLTIPFPYTETDAANWFKITTANAKKNGMPTNLAIRHKTEGCIGDISVFTPSGIEGHFDEIGYWLAEPFRGRGLMTEVLKKFVEFQFETRPKLVRLQAYTAPENPTSGRVLEKCGFVKEGFCRKIHIKNGVPLDSILFARVRE